MPRFDVAAGGGEGEEGFRLNKQHVLKKERKKSGKIKDSQASWNESVRNKSCEPRRRRLRREQTSGAEVFIVA